MTRVMGRRHSALAKSAHLNSSGVPYKGKPYTGEWYEWREYRGTLADTIEPFVSDHECHCVLVVEGGEKVPDFACETCGGTGLQRTLSRYERSLKKGLRGFKGYNYTGV